MIFKIGINELILIKLSVIFNFSSTKVNGSFGIHMKKEIHILFSSLIPGIVKIIEQFSLYKH